MRAAFVRSEWENEARTIASIYFLADQPYYFTPGQYASLSVPHVVPDHRGISRTMTFITSPSDKLLGITTRLSRKNTSTYKQALKVLQPGYRCTLTDAMGDLVLPLDDTIPLVFVAGGVGIASFISMVRWLSERDEKRDVTLLYAVRDVSDIIFQEVFDAYADHGTITKTLFTTDHKIDTYPVKGIVKKARLTSADIVAAMKPEAQIYISGTEKFVDQLVHELQDSYHIPQYRIAFDFFDGYTET